MVKSIKKTTKKIAKKRGRKPKKKLYFGPEVQDAIVRYNDLDPEKKQSARNKIYQNEIHKAFDKLAENIINTFKFTYFDYGFEDIKHETVAFLVMNIHKYDHTTGSKAFSYFSVVAKNYLILHNNNNYKKYKSHDSIESHVQATDDKSYQNSRVLRGLVTPSVQEDDDLHSLVKDVAKYFNKNIPSLFKKKRDIDIAYAVIELLERTDEIENFNKKALYLLIREMTGVNTNNITKVVNLMKSHYRKIIVEYNRSGIIMSELPSNKRSFF